MERDSKKGKVKKDRKWMRLSSVPAKPCAQKMNSLWFSFFGAQGSLYTASTGTNEKDPKDRTALFPESSLVLVAMVKIEYRWHRAPLRSS